MARKAAVPLSRDEQLVVEAIASLGADGSTSYLQDIARHSGLDEAAVRQALHSLTRRHNIVTEVVPEVPPDLGPQYVLHDFE